LIWCSRLREKGGTLSGKRRKEEGRGPGGEKKTGKSLGEEHSKPSTCRGKEGARLGKGNLSESLRRKRKPSKIRRGNEGEPSNDLCRCKTKSREKEILTEKGFQRGKGGRAQQGKKLLRKKALLRRGGIHPVPFNTQRRSSGRKRERTEEEKKIYKGRRQTRERKRGMAGRL